MTPIGIGLTAIENQVSKRSLERLKPVVFGFAAPLKSGKTTISIPFAREMGWPYGSFGRHIRMVAHQQGLDESRETLQQVGASLVAQDCAGLCQAVLAQLEDWRPGESGVIDGIRHLEVKAELERLVAPARLVLVYISVDDEVRLARLRNEGITDPERIKRIESDSTEVEVKTILPEIADFILEDEDPQIQIEKLKTFYNSLSLENEDSDSADDTVEFGEQTTSIDCETKDDIDQHTENARTLDRKVPPIIPPEEFAAKWELERKWLEENCQEYAGCWVALDGDQLVASGASAREVYAALKAAGISSTFVTRIKHADDLPFIE